MEEKALEIPFLYPDPRVEENKSADEEYSDLVWKRHYFWDEPSVHQWFKHRGYTLYEKDGFAWYPQIQSPYWVEGSFPYPYHTSYTEEDSRPRSADSCGRGQIVFAQDDQGRHVVIKLMSTATDQWRVTQFLHRQSKELLRDNRILPVLDILLLEGYALAVMPRWGTLVLEPRFQTLAEAVQIMHDMLKGLAFLHEHRIIHRDISFVNTLVNHFSSGQYYLGDPERLSLRRRGLLTYALMDFDLAIMAPPHASLRDFRLPYINSWCGRWPQPYDTCQGENEYNPFAFDVGTLGLNFCSEFSHVSKDLPFLAPLFDGMTARNASRRMTAQEALEFLERCLQELPQGKLEAPYTPITDFSVSFDKYNRWQHVSPELKQRWASYMGALFRYMCASFAGSARINLEAS